MAILKFSELVECIKMHPRYEEFAKGIPPEFALYISFSEKQTDLASELVALADGREMYLDRLDDTSVIGFEIT